MNDQTPENLPALIRKPAQALAAATTAAEDLDARRLADVAYDAAKLAGRLLKAKGASEEVIAACRKAMRDALIIGAHALCRLADESRFLAEVFAAGRRCFRCCE